MPQLKYEKPPESLLDELREVEENANALAEAICKSNQLPANFPKDEIVELAMQLAKISQGTAEGCRQPLEYAKARLPSIRRTFILTPARSQELEKNDCEPPPLMRGERIDDCLARLTVSVVTALEEYRRLASILDSIDETDTSPSIDLDRSDPSVIKAIENAIKTESKIDVAINEFDEIANSDSIMADKAKRQMQDTKRLLGLSRVELGLPNFVPKWFKATVSSLRNYPELIRKTAKGLIVGVDIAQVFANRWSEFQDRILNAMFEGIRRTADDLIILTHKWEKEKNSEVASQKNNEQPADFDLDEVHAMIARGENPPSRWIPWITKLNFLDFNSSDKSGINTLSDLTPIADLSALESLKLCYTDTVDLTPIAGLSALKELSLSGTQVLDLTPIAGISSIQSLDLSDTQVEDLTPIAGLNALTSLDLSATKIVDLNPIAGLTELKSLNLTDTQVVDLAPIANFTALKSLDLRSTQVLELLPIARFAALESLGLMHTQVADLTPISGLIALESLYLSYTQIEELAPIAGLKNLMKLYLNGTRVDNLAPIAGLSKLKLLDLNGMQIGDLTPIAELTALQTIYIINTKIVDLTPIAGLDALKIIYVEKDKVTKLSRNLHRKGIVMGWDNPNF